MRDRVLTFIYHFLRLEERFHHLDKKQKGFLNRKDLEILPELAANPLANRIMNVILCADSPTAISPPPNLISSNVSGQEKITLENFMAFMMPFSKKAPREMKLKFAFCVYDVDQDGKEFVRDQRHSSSCKIKYLTGFQNMLIT